MTFLNRNHLITLFLIVFLKSTTFSESCVYFTSPKPGKTITTAACTLSLTSTCNDIQRVELQARYFTLNSDTATIISIGSLAKPPFDFIWDISQIPNQLFAGVAFLAEVIHKNGEIEDVRREGVFFAHQPVSFETKNFQYNYAGSQDLKGDIIKIPTDRNNLKIQSSIYWNENDLTVIIDVEDPFFHSNMSKSALSEIGAEILLDPTMSRKPYPNKDIIAYSIPLYGIPYTISYKPAFDESGSFKLISSSSPCDFPYSITKEDFKGYKIYFPIPKKVFGNSIPDSLTCNISLKLLDQNNQLTNISWVKSSLYDIHSPYIWNTIIRQPKPFMKNRVLIGSISFIICFLITFLIGTSIQHRKPQLKKDIEKTESEQKLFDELKDAIDRQITYKNLSDNIIAKEMHISPKKLTNLVKKLTGIPFQNYLMLARVEIAKERLRSSNCSESTIADACGFHDEKELEKYFLKFERMIPSKYRQQQQVV